MFLTPCTEIEVYYFTAGDLLGWYGIVIVSITYLAITVLIMLLLVYFGFRRFEKIRSQFIEHYGKQITGVILVILGLWYLV
ncbi:MAG: hypothetical protein C5S47_07555 [Candidatus Methanogasteraceae archaeon]|nr:MAG: hypothetical protein C5S47_07555 [ANME-2 cluster archaeon]